MLDADAALTLPGVRFFTLHDASRTADTVRRLYELVRLGVIDDPGTAGAFMGPDEFAATLFEPYYGRWADAQFLAAVGDEWIGLVNLQPRSAQRAEFGVTVVVPAYRGRGVARALKARAIRYAREAGIATLRTRNDAGNEAILTLNRSFGFRVLR